MFGKFGIALRFPGSHYACYIDESSRQGGPVKSTTAPTGIAVWGSLEDAAKWLQSRGMADGKPVPVGVGMVASIEPVDPAALSRDRPEWLRGALFEIPPASLPRRESPATNFVKPAPKPARPVQASLF